MRALAESSVQTGGKSTLNSPILSRRRLAAASAQVTVPGPHERNFTGTIAGSSR
jgi:hypothetical protein